MTITGMVILYNPANDVTDNIKSYLPFLETLYVFDNSDKKNEGLMRLLSGEKKIKVFYDGHNKGIAVRLNEGASLGLQNGYEWMLTMDQDSYFSESNFETYLTCIDDMPDKQKIAMFGVSHEHNNQSTTCEPVQKNNLITSGSIINLNLFTAIGGFDEMLFIDDVDTDYCYTALSKDYKIIKFKNIFLTHTLGNVSLHKSFLNFKTTSRTLHSPLRLYYMVRNFFYINKKHPENIFLAEKARRKKDLLHRVKNNFLYGKNKLTLLHFVASGWLDYKRNKMGKKD